MRISILTISLALIAAMMSTSCSNDNKQSKSRYKYETVEGDPLGAKIYTLKNGLKVYISENNEEPRVVTQIAVRTGSKQDPADATGLAHYLEHMLFKGTSVIGTKDWEAEKVVLQQISDLYEENRATDDPDERKKIYAQIDSLSGVAAAFAIGNEFDKMVSSLGARGTNAYTSNEQTVYINDIPANELDKWAALESQRMSELVLRLFHTELEVVYEEFNRGQDSDNQQAYYALLENLFQEHQYGKQTTIGTSEHLKSPSMEKIHTYFKTHYIPNNMAIILVGDVNPDDAIDIIEKHFGGWEAGELPTFEVAQEKPIESPIVKDVTGVQAEFVLLGYRLPGVKNEDLLTARVVDGLLSNGQAGLIDINLVQGQKVLSAYSSVYTMSDYSMFIFQGTPRQGQSLEEVSLLLRSQIEKLKAGDFPDWMVEAVVNDMKLNALKGSESNWARAGEMVDAFVTGQDWKQVVNAFDRMQKLGKEDVQAFTTKYFADNYVQINKREGVNTAVKVEKPLITPVEIDREAQSPYYASWDSIESGRLEPQFLDYKTLINIEKLDNGITFNSIKNENNELFSLYYILNMGTRHDQVMGLAVSYLPYLGTEKYSAEELAQELFKLGVSFDVFSSDDRMYVTLSGLNSSLDEGVKLFEHILANVQPDEEALANMVDGEIKKRQDALKNKNQILYRGLANYAKYGPENPLTNQLSEEELRSLTADELVAKIKEITSYKHEIFYYGPQENKEVVAMLKENHKVPENLKDYPEPAEFPELPTDENQVYFAHFDMVQSEILLLSKGPDFDKNLMASSNLFNQYFGSGLSSIVFQEIRESKALAYSAYSNFSTPNRADKAHYVQAYIGAQVDKLPEATDAMLSLMSDMPRADLQFESAREAALKQIEANRITRQSIFWDYITARERGIDYDIREENYAALQKMTIDDMQAFFDKQIKDRTYTYCVIGNKNMVDLEVLEKLGPVKVLSLEDLFGYAPDSPEAVSMMD